jgi:prolipoprotein diacylglyceryltransferase
VVIPAALGSAFVRIGNLMNSEIVGKYTGNDSGFIFQRLGDTAPRYPTQIFEALGYAIVFIILWVIYKKTDKKKKEGFIFGMFLILIFVVRFIVEFWKERQDGEDLTTLLNKGQLLSIPFILVGVFLVLMHYFKKK